MVKVMRLVISLVDNLGYDDHRDICRRPFEQAVPVRCQCMHGQQLRLPNEYHHEKSSRLLHQPDV